MKHFKIDFIAFGAAIIVLGLVSGAGAGADCCVKKVKDVNLAFLLEGTVSLTFTPAQDVAPVSGTNPTAGVAELDGIVPANVDVTLRLKDRFKKNAFKFYRIFIEGLNIDAFTDEEIICAILNPCVYFPQTPNWEKVIALRNRILSENFGLEPDTKDIVITKKSITNTDKNRYDEDGARLIPGSLPPCFMSLADIKIYLVDPPAAP